MPSSYDNPQYSPWTGLVYVFNLIVGTGALTLPAAFSKAGWALGLGFIIVLAVISFMTVTFVIEAMSIANAILTSRKREMSESSDLAEPIRPLLGSRRERERDPLIPPEYGDQSEEIRMQNSTMAVFEITQRVEMGGMAAMFFSRCGLYLFYVCICIYLYGDLAIYITAVAKSVRDVVCTYQVSENSTIAIPTNLMNGTDFCWSEEDGMTRFGAYRLFAILFILILGPFCFFNVSKTKYLQIMTTLMRWTAFLIMIGIASTRLIENKGTGHPVPARIAAIPNLFGVCVYSFMCHHSLPSLITPISKKKHLFSLFSADYLLIAVFYLLLALTGVFAYDHIEDLYTLNFVPGRIDGSTTDTPLFVLIVQYFLSLFPVFTLSTSFPIIAITLRNNLKSLFDVVDEEDEDLDESSTHSGSGVHGYSRVHVRRRRNHTSAFCKLLSKCGFPLMAILPPFMVAMFMEDVKTLVTITGSYAGAGIQYIIPIFLVFHARKRYLSVANPYSSPFRHVAWLWFVLIWAAVSISFVTINYVVGDEL